MTIDEFIERLSNLPREWRPGFNKHRALRIGCDREDCMCPITAVEFASRDTGDRDDGPYSTYQWDDAANDIGLSGGEASDIVISADSRGRWAVPHLRCRLYSALRQHPMWGTWR